MAQKTPLVKGIVDFFKADESLKNIPVIGPSQYAAQLEGSKEFAKEFLVKNNILQLSTRVLLRKR